MTFPDYIYYDYYNVFYYDYAEWELFYEEDPLTINSENRFKSIYFYFLISTKNYSETYDPANLFPISLLIF